MKTDSTVEEREEYQPCKLVVLDRKEQLRSKRRYWMLRRGQDIFFSALALLLLWPIMLIIALVIYIDDPHGSPIFAQIRCGRDAKHFKMYKFRSMYVDAEDRLNELLQDNEMDGPAFKMKDDPRITRVGHFIRKTSLDELPQIFNIFMGQMSIIGPRPALWNQDDLYEERAKYGANGVKPGLSGWAQINGRDELPIDVKARLDGEYVEKMSFGFDVKCFFGTITSVLKRDGVVEGGTGAMEKEKEEANK